MAKRWSTTAGICVGIWLSAGSMANAQVTAPIADGISAPVNFNMLETDQDGCFSRPNRSR